MTATKKYAEKVIFQVIYFLFRKSKCAGPVAAAILISMVTLFLYSSSIHTVEVRPMSEKGTVNINHLTKSLTHTEMSKVPSLQAYKLPFTRETETNPDNPSSSIPVEPTTESEKLKESQFVSAQKLEEYNLSKQQTLHDARVTNKRSELVRQEAARVTQQTTQTQIGEQIDFQSSQMNTDSSKVQNTALVRTLGNIDKCMHGSNLSSADLVEVARQNAQLFMEQYGKIISPDYLSNYSNHCWETDYSVSISRLTRKQSIVKVQLGKTRFMRIIGWHWFEYNMRIEIEKYKGGYHSSMICLPNIYLLGFEKSGSTFFWCVLSKILNRPTGSGIQADKEPYFWTPFNYKPSPPSPRNLAAFYVPMFLRASDPKLSTEKRSDLTLIDGCPSTVLEWPRFSDTEPDLANYCLLPSALPELFPESKYVVIMRNPVRMLYSAFWWSFHQHKSRAHDMMSEQVNSNYANGPLAFHLRAGKKIVQFLKCMNSHPSVQSESKCDLWQQSKHNYSSCIGKRVHLLAECVANITNKRGFLEAVIHRGIYYVHVRKWLQTVPRERIFFTTIERLSSDTYSTAREVYKFLKGNTKFNTTEEGMDHITSSCRENMNIINYKRPELAMKKTTRTMLEKFFEPFNEMLSELLEDEQFLWQN